MQPADDLPGCYESIRSSSGYAILPLFAILAWIHSCWNRGGTMRAGRRYGCLVRVAIILAIAGIALIIVGYRNNSNWSGFTTKTLWDWLQLLIIPVLLAIGGLLYNNARDRTDREVASDNQGEDALQAYLDSMSELLLEKHLRDSQPEDEVRKIARVRTLTVLRRLDAKRRVAVLHFLQEAGLIDKDKSIISLKEANLRDIYLFQYRLSQENFSETNLSGAILMEASIMFADFTGADLSGTVLFKAYISSTKLSETDLNEAYLREADLSQSDLSSANLTRADLNSSKLIFVKLTEADLTEVDLTKTNIFRADLRKANLSRANLSDADLRRADLRRANLSGANLSDANLSGANLSGADPARGANLRRANLKDATGITVETLEKQAKSLKGATMPDGSIHP